MEGEATRFADRREAGRVLARGLGDYRGKNALVLGIPRGGVPVAAEVAAALDADMDVIVARKLGAPGEPELAIGAVTANGGEYLDERVASLVGATRPYIERVRQEQVADARRRDARFRGNRPMQKIENRVVILVDDGLATGATMRAAVRSARKHRPSRLIVAVPVGSRDACAWLREEADELVCLSEPEPFGAVGYFYGDFSPVEDEEVERILRDFSARKTPARAE